MKTDVVYILGTGSTWQNNDIKYSLRSLDKNMLNVGKVFIVGEKPDFTKNIIHIPCLDIYGEQNADGNIINKILIACFDARLSDNFLLMSDDHLILRKVSAGNTPFYYKTDLSTLPEEYFTHNTWRQRLGNTLKELHEKKLPTMHYDCHLPVLINKLTFRRAMREFDYKSGIGLTVKTLYCNWANVNGMKVKNMKYTIYEPYTIPELERRLKNHDFANFKDSGLTPEVKNWIEKRFNKPSKYEKTNGNN